MNLAQIFSEKDFDILPLEKSETIPSSWYVFQDFHSIDGDAIISKEWNVIGHTTQLENVGDYILGEVANNPVIAVKGNDKKIKGFYNVCRHRGGPLALENGCAKMLKCKYHGWTYTLEGMLRGVPRFDRVDLFDKKDFGLVPLNLDIWEGLIFVNISDNPTPLKEKMNGIRSRIFPYDLNKKKFHKRVHYDIDCNWKVYVDNYLEGYHVPIVHPELAKLLDYKEYKTEIFENYSLQSSPVNEEGNYFKKSGGVFYYFVYPNWMMNIFPGRLQINIVVPVSFNKCRVIFDYYYDDLVSIEAKNIINEDLEYSDKVQKEDIEICEKVQKGLESRAYNRGRFSVECEEGVYHFQCLLKKSYKRFISTK
jgi:phenylpropionate dioxygenase-like ring-hydroxylating dioxygenase large terminal subunit